MFQCSPSQVMADPTMWSYHSKPNLAQMGALQVHPLVHLSPPAAVNGTVPNGDGGALSSQQGAKSGQCQSCFCVCENGHGQALKFWNMPNALSQSWHAVLKFPFPACAMFEESFSHGMCQASSTSQHTVLGGLSATQRGA